MRHCMKFDRKRPKTKGDENAVLNYKNRVSIAFDVYASIYTQLQLKRQ